MLPTWPHLFTSEFFLFSILYIYMTIYFGKLTVWSQLLKTILACTLKSCIIQRHQAFETRWPGLLSQAAFSDVVKPRDCISWPIWLLRGINKTAWDAKLTLTAELAYPVSYASLGHLLMAQYCCMLNVCLTHLQLFTCPTSHPILPTCPPPIDLICDITALKQLPQKSGAFK